ncbi:hypothetical protein QEN19_004275 [Hanseniaspora menglaensis]
MDLNSFFGQINSTYNHNNNNNSNANHNINNNALRSTLSVNNNNGTENVNQINSIADDTPAILLEQLAYIDTFMPQIEEDVIANYNQGHDASGSNNTQTFLGGDNTINNHSDLLNSQNNFMPTALDDRLAEELKIFADESFIFPDEDKPDYNATDDNGVANFGNSGSNESTSSFLNINNSNNHNSNILNGARQKQQSRKDLRGKNFKTPFGNDDNKAFLKRHNNNNNRAGSPLQQEILPLNFDYISGSNNLQNSSQNQSYTPSVHSIHSTSASNSVTSFSQQTPSNQVTLLEQIKLRPTSELNTFLPPHLQARYTVILQKIISENDENWGNFSKEEAALLLLFKEHYLAQLPVNLLQYDQFQDLSVVEGELYKVLGMAVAHREAIEANNNMKKDEENFGAKRRSSIQDDDLENQVKKLIKISEKLQKKITSLEVENKMLKNLLSKDE